MRNTVNLPVQVKVYEYVYNRRTKYDHRKKQIVVKQRNSEMAT